MLPSIAQVTWDQLEAEFWRIVEDGEEPVEVYYGADLDTASFGSAFPKPGQAPLRTRTLPPAAVTASSKQPEGPKGRGSSSGGGATTWEVKRERGSSIGPGGEHSRRERSSSGGLDPSGHPLVLITPPSHPGIAVATLGGKTTVTKGIRSARTARGSPAPGSLKRSSSYTSAASSGAVVKQEGAAAAVGAPAAVGAAGGGGGGGGTVAGKPPMRPAATPRRATEAGAGASGAAAVASVKEEAQNPAAAAAREPSPAPASSAREQSPTPAVATPPPAGAAATPPPAAAVAEGGAVKGALEVVDGSAVAVGVAATPAAPGAGDVDMDDAGYGAAPAAAAEKAAAEVPKSAAAAAAAADGKAEGRAAGAMEEHEGDLAVYEHYCEHKWNVNNFPRLNGAHPSMLQYVDDAVPGIVVPWLYVGMQFSSFCWHVEDHLFYSVNYHHYGEPKRWYSVPGSARKAFEVGRSQGAGKVWGFWTLGSLPDSGS